jgi:REP element-mobilizing transposase RayT
MISRTRGYIPHLEDSQSTYFLTFRLDDSLPVHLIWQWKEELNLKKNSPNKDLKLLNRLEREFQSRIERHLDSNSGNCWLKDPKIAHIVANALRYFDGQRYVLHAWTIMPNHVHVLFTAHEEFNLASIIHSWKSFTATQANRWLQRSGRFWQPEYFEKLIRSQRQFEFCIRYILNNPVKAGLCKEPHNWKWLGVSPDIQYLLDRFFL